MSMWNVVRYSLNGAEIRGVATSYDKAERIKDEINDDNCYIVIEKKN